MKRLKCLQVVSMYKDLLALEGFTLAARMPLGSKFQTLGREQRLAHAVHLTQTITHHATRPDGEGKACRHLGFLQALLFFEGFFTLEELIQHNTASVSDDDTRW